MVQQKAKRGTVSVQSFRGMLRLRWTYRGERYTLSTGTPDGKLNRTVAEAKARIIEGDMVTGNFDPSLVKYSHSAQEITNISVVDLLAKFTEYKRKRLYDRSLDKFKALKAPVQEFFGDKPAANVDDDLADKFRLHLATWLAPVTQRERLITLKACWEWGIKQKLVTDNPWKDTLRSVKVPPKQKPKPFTHSEVKAILQGFQSSRHYNHYVDFVAFLFSTGCRLGEAIGLQWQHLSEDCGKVWIGESMSRGGKRKSTKTNRSREFKLPAKLQATLLARHQNQSPDALVFPSPAGKHIDDHNFCRRAWRSVLLTAKVPYRHPYNCRHTYISHALAAGCKPMAIAEMTGHDPKVLFSRYAADIGGGLQAPDLFD